MKNLAKRLKIGAGLGLALLTTGCNSIISHETPYEVWETEKQTYSGKPLSVVSNVNDTISTLSVVLRMKNGKDHLYNSTTYSHIGHETITDVAALIQAEINDGDNQEIQLEADKLDRFYSINVSGHDMSWSDGK
jgi:hypothetical protein